MKQPDAAALAPQIRALRQYYAEHRSIPSLSGLARLWGYGAKSWAAAIAQRLKREGILEDAPGRRLRPGPLFTQAAEPQRAPRRRRHADPIDRAAGTWATEVSDQAAEAYALSFRIVTIAALIEQGFREEVRPLGLNSGEVLVLDALRRCGPPYESSAARLKDSFLVSFAGIGKRLERLERRGYVERRADASDRRRQLVRLTPAGLALLREGFRKRFAGHIRALMALPPAERRQLAASLRQLQELIDER